MSPKIKLSFVIAVILLICVCISVFYFIHENQQASQIQELSIQNESLNRQISDLQANQNELINQNSELINQVDILQSQIYDNKDNIDLLCGKAVYSRTAYNYLAIGNSITLHDEADYWWNKCGMAATTPDNDYVHLVAQYIKDTTGDVCYYAVNYAQWEMQSHDRAETYSIIDPYLSPELDLITVQLSENVTDSSSFESDYTALIEHIKSKAPNAKILIIDNFWFSDERVTALKNAALYTNVRFISLDEIKGKPEYQCGLGTIVYDSLGNPHTVEHKGVACHPGDKGMQYIADKIIAEL